MASQVRVRARRHVALLLGALSAGGAAVAQVAVESGPQQEISALVVAIEELASELETAQARLTPLIDAVAPDEAEGWLASSPIERYTERAGAEGLPDPERALWQQTVAHEQAGAERVRGALDRAGFALAGTQRLEEAMRRIDALRAPPHESGRPDDERPLSRIDQEIGSSNARRAQVGLALEQRRETLARLEEQLRGQTEILESSAAPQTYSACRPPSGRGRSSREAAPRRGAAA